MSQKEVRFLAKQFQQKSQNCIFCVDKSPWKKFDLLKNVEFFSFFRLWAEKKTNFRELFAKAVITVFLVSKLCFEEKQFCWKTYKFVHLFGLRAEGTFHLSRRLRGRSVQRALTVSWGALEEKQFFRRTHQIFDRFRTLGKKLGVWLNFTWRVVKTAFFRVQEKLWGKFFCWKNYILIHLFRVFSRKKMSLAKLHQEHCQNCILCVNETIRGKINLVKNGYVLFIFFGLWLEKKLESSENFGKVVRAAFFESSNFFEKKAFSWTIYNFLQPFELS